MSLKSNRTASQEQEYAFTEYCRLVLDKSNHCVANRNPLTFFRSSRILFLVVFTRPRSATVQSRKAKHGHVPSIFQLTSTNWITLSQLGFFWRCLFFRSSRIEFLVIFIITRNAAAQRHNAKDRHVLNIIDLFSTNRSTALQPEFSWHRLFFRSSRIMFPVIFTHPRNTAVQRHRAKDRHILNIF